MPYRDDLITHLETYKETRLGVFEFGLDKNKKRYRHILPIEIKALNIIEKFRAELVAYIEGNESVSYDSGFHHLNSSQAFAFNLFFPFFWIVEQSTVLQNSFDLEGVISEWHFEYIPQTEEGSNIDVAWKSRNSPWNFCEVKLTETNYGTATPNEERLAKLNDIYAPRLQNIVPPDFLNPDTFFKNYQVLRNLSYLHLPEVENVFFLMPRGNTIALRHLNLVLQFVSAEYRSQIHVVFLEDLVEKLLQSVSISPELRCYMNSFSEKYLPEF
jgi:hypothetical protein